jgi:hypothetical protein
MVAELVGKVRRRLLWNQVLAEATWALCASMGSLVLLLLVGAEILKWYWVALAPLAALGVGVWRMIRRAPSAYAAAQLVDRRLRLADTLSTAIFFDTAGGRRRASAEVRRAQRAQAERASQSACAADAVPYHVPRAAYALGVLLAAASSLLALRYGLDRRLDLKKPLARILQPVLNLPQFQLAALEKHSPPDAHAAPQDVPGAALEEPRGHESRRTPEASDGNRNSDQADPGDRVSAEQQGETAKQAGADSGSREKERPGEDPGTQAEARQGAPPSDSSLMAKFQDAVQNLLSRMRQQPAAGSPPQAQARGPVSQPAKPRAGQGQSQPGPPQPGQQAPAQENPQGTGNQAARNDASQSAGQDGGEQSSQQEASGIGSRDGNKDIKLAEQLAAMGKISEIIGKRSANVSGEVTVEVQSTSQQLQTPYSQRDAAHRQATAEINRDEVPVALEPYVQQYFEQVRRANRTAKPTRP